MDDDTGAFAPAPAKLEIEFFKKGKHGPEIHPFNDTDMTDTIRIDHDPVRFRLPKKPCLCFHIWFSSLIRHPLVSYICRCASRFSFFGTYLFLRNHMRVHTSATPELQLYSRKSGTGRGFRAMMGEDAFCGNLLRFWCRHKNLRLLKNQKRGRNARAGIPVTRPLLPREQHTGVRRECPSAPPFFPAACPTSSRPIS